MKVWQYWSEGMGSGRILGEGWNASGRNSRMDR